MGVEDSTSPDIARRVDARCDEFERALAVGGSPVIEDYLANAAPDERRSLLEELLWLEVDFRIAHGEQPKVADYSDRFPEIPSSRLALIVSGLTAEDAWIGRKLHVYQCVSLIGSGAMGRVYLALHHDLQRHCAIKILSPRRGVCDADYVARFHCEGQAAAALIHPNIVTLHAVGQIDETHFLEMEYVQGMSGDRQAPPGREQRFPCQQQDQAPFRAQPPLPSFLGRGRKAFRSSSCVFQRHAYH